MGALRITYTILGVPYYNYGINGPQRPVLIIKAPVVGRLGFPTRNLHALDPQAPQPSAPNLNYGLGGCRV